MEIDGPSREHLGFLLKTGRHLLWQSYWLQAGMCLAGVVCLWSGLDSILTNRPLMGGIMIVAAFLNGKNFASVAEDRQKTRQTLAGLREAMKRLDDLPLS